MVRTHREQPNPAWCSNAGANCVIHMDSYKPVDVTTKAMSIVERFADSTSSVDGTPLYPCPDVPRSSLSPSSATLYAAESKIEAFAGPSARVPMPRTVAPSGRVIVRSKVLLALHPGVAFVWCHSVV